MNEVQLPKRLDLGRVALGESTTQQLQLSCKLPLDFAFTVTVIKHNKAFTVSPMSGTVPANGSAAISITFMPASLATEELQLQVRAATYKAVGCRCCCAHTMHWQPKLSCTPVKPHTAFSD
jgi:hypothetical protein